MGKEVINSGEKQPKVSIITINYHQPELTCLFLKSVSELDYINLEIILVDNGALKYNEEYYQLKFPNIHYLYSKKNLGFAGANNLAMSNATGDFFFIVNNDTELSKDLITSLLMIFKEEMNVGAVSPKIKYFDKPDTIQYAGFTKVNELTGRNEMLGNNELDLGQHDVRRATSYAHGAAMMVNRDVYKDIGGFFEMYFMYYEELDWSHRMIRNGYKIFYEPKGVIYHKVSMSIGKGNPLKTYYYIRNRILFMRRSSTWLNLIGFYIYVIFFTIPVSVFRYLSKGRFKELVYFFKGILWNIGSPLPAK